MPKMIEVQDDFMPWPYYQPYGIVKIAAPKKPRSHRRPRAATKALFTSKLFKPKVIPNKKRKAKIPTINPEE